MPAPLIIRILGDERSYIRAAENTLAANTKLDASFATVGVNANRSAEVQIAAALKAHQALRANISGLQTAAAAAPVGSAEQLIALRLARDEQAKLSRSLGVTTAAGHRFAGATREGERDLGKLSRGALAGSGVFSRMGRSLAFASGGFLAFASGAQFLRRSIDAARELAVAQRQVNQQLRVSGLTWKTYGKQIDEADLRLSHISGFTNPQLLQSFGFLFRVTGNVNTSLRLNALAADVARARQISLSAASLALSKAYGGQVTSLRRLGIVVPQNLKGMAALNFVQRKFAGQAQAGTSASDRFNATLTDTEEIIGATLLPITNRYLARLGDWLAKMNESGRLQKDVNTAVHDAGAVFHLLGGAIRTVDRVTGSFTHTLELLATIKLASWTADALLGLKELALAFGVVRTAAEGAAAAEALAAGGAAGGVARAVGGGGGIVAAGRFAGRAAAIEAAAPFAAFAAIPAIAAQSPVQGPKNLKIIGYTSAGIPIALGSDGNYYMIGGRGYRQVNKAQALSFIASFVGVRGAPVITKQLRNLPRGANVVPRALQVPGFQPPRPQRTAPTLGRPLFGGAQRIKPLTQFDLKPLENLAAAQAALTRTTRDDVAAAREVVARIRRLIDQGRLKGAGLIQALQAEGSALSTIWSAEDAAAQKRAAAAQAAKDRIQAQIENSIDPLKLEVALSRAEAFGKPILPRLLALLRAARKALASGDLNLTQQKEALDQITSLKQQIKDARTGQDVTFTLSPRLQLALAKDEALGRDTTKDLLKARAAILKFIRTHKHNIAALTDAYNQLAAINQQLGSTAQSALGLFKQASTRALTAGLGLTEAQRKALRARLSQLGPGGTVPGSGVGAAGFVIGSDDRPIVIHTKTYLDGREVARNTTKHQQKRRSRNPSQRRGPNAGMAGA